MTSATSQWKSDGVAAMTPRMSQAFGPGGAYPVATGQVLPCVGRLRLGSQAWANISDARSHCFVGVPAAIGVLPSCARSMLDTSSLASGTIEPR